MPTKTFAFADVIDSANNFLGSYGYSNPDPIGNPIGDIIYENANIYFNFSSPGIINCTLVDTASVGPMLGEPSWQAMSGLSVTNMLTSFTLEYTNIVNEIPEDAKIKKLVWHRPEEMSYSSTLTSTGSVIGPTTSSGMGSFTAESSTDLIYDRSESLAGSAADIIIFDYIGTETYITRQDLIDDHSIFTFNSSGHFNAQIASNGSSTRAASVSFSYSLGTDWRVEVTYEAAPVTWTLVSPPANQAIQAGTTIVYTFGEGEASGITDIEINGVPAEFTVDEDTDTVTITAPDFPTEGPEHTATPTVTSTQFSGTVPLQTVPTINFENAPGIYTLIDGRTHDTYYNRVSSIEGTEINTKIPNPTGRTSYY